MTLKLESSKLMKGYKNRKKTSDFRRRTSVESGGRCIWRLRGTRVARSLKLEVPNWGSGTSAASELARHCEATRVSHDALCRPISTADSESVARTWTYNTRSEMTGCTGEDLSGTEQGAGNAPVAKRSGRLSEANPKGRKGPRVGGLLAVSCDGEFYVPIYGGNGNIMGYVDESGTLVAKFVYDPYGNVVLLEGDLPLPLKDGPPVDISGLHGSDFSFGFSTKYHDREVGLIAYQLRSYSPRLGRWLNRDPIEEEGGVNLYATCANTPILHVDYLGLESGSVFVQGVGAGWAGATVTLNGRIAVQLNGELYYLTLDTKGLRPLSKARIPPSGSTTAVFLYREGNPNKALRIDYHQLKAFPNKKGVWHLNTKGGIAKIANSKYLNHAIKPSVTMTGRVVTLFKDGGRYCFIAGAAMTGIEIYKADNHVREAVRQVFGWSGAIAGGRIGSWAGAKAGMSLAIAIGQSGPQISTPEELITVPVLGVIGGIGGGIVGGIVGWKSGASISDKVYDWKFSPLMKEEWNVCE